MRRDIERFEEEFERARADIRVRDAEIKKLETGLEKAYSALMELRKRVLLDPWGRIALDAREVVEIVEIVTRSALENAATSMIRPTEYFTARRCAWCRQFASEQDEAVAAKGGVVRHGICEPCASSVTAKWVGKVRVMGDDEPSPYMIDLPNFGRMEVWPAAQAAPTQSPEGT